MEKIKYRIMDYLKTHGWIYKKPEDNSQRVFKKNADSGMRQKIQKFGSFMGGMIMPTIGVFIAWGLWASAFIYNNPTSHGWFVTPELGKLVPIGIKWLLPLLIAINAGKMIYGIRGATLSAFLTIVIIVGTTTIWDQYGAGETVYKYIPENYQFYTGQELITGTDSNQYFIVSSDGYRVMGTTTYNEVISRNVFNGFAGRDPNQIIGAMVVGPIGTKIFKTIEENYIDTVKPGFEMLIRNFSLAIIAILMGLIMFYVWPWIMYGITIVITLIIQSMGQNKYIYPILTIFTEPLRTIFLNNALNYGVMAPLGLNDISQQQINNIANPHSIYYLYAGNAGPGLGLLLSFVVWKKGSERANAAGASLVEFVGGIHEVYYVYVVQKPIYIISTILGAAASMTVFSFAGGGTSTIVSPGSIISVVSTSPTGELIGINIAGVITGVIVTFAVSTIIQLIQKKKNLNSSINEQEITFSDEGMTFNSKNTSVEVVQTKEFKWSEVKKLIVACDAGMGSSAMAAGIIKKWVKNNNVDVSVSNCALKDLPSDADVIVTTNVFEKFAKDKVPNAFVYSVEKFLDKGAYDNLYKNLLEKPIDKIEILNNNSQQVNLQVNKKELDNKSLKWVNHINTLLKTEVWILILIVCGSVMLLADAILFDANTLLYKTTITYSPSNGNVPPMNNMGSNSITSVTTTTQMANFANYLFSQIAVTIFIVAMIGFGIWLIAKLFNNPLVKQGVIDKKINIMFISIMILLIVLSFGLSLALLLLGMYLDMATTTYFYIFISLTIASYLSFVITIILYKNKINKFVNIWMNQENNNNAIGDNNE